MVGSENNGEELTLGQQYHTVCWRGCEAAKGLEDNNNFRSYDMGGFVSGWTMRSLYRDSNGIAGLTNRDRK